MANLDNITRADAVQLINHDLRQHEHYSNEDIQLKYANENYNLTPEREENPVDYFKNRIANLSVCSQKKTTVLQSWVVTLPKDMPFKDCDKFMQASYDFFENFYGKNNMVSGAVHKDEYIRGEDGVHPKDEKSGMPHLTIKAIPEVNGRVNARNKTPQKCMKKIHQELEKYVSKELGYEVHILNGATINGQKTITELKLQRAEEELAEKDAELEGKDAKLAIKDKQIEALTSEVNELNKIKNGNVLSEFGEEKTTLLGRQYYDVSPEDANKISKAIKEYRAEIRQLKKELPIADDVADLTTQKAKQDAIISYQDAEIKELNKQNNSIETELEYYKLPVVRDMAIEISSKLSAVTLDIDSMVLAEGILNDKIETEVKACNKVCDGLIAITEADTPDTMKNAHERFKSYSDGCIQELHRFRGSVNRIMKALPVDVANKIGDKCRDCIKNCISSFKALVKVQDDEVEIMPKRVQERQKHRKPPSRGIER